MKYPSINVNDSIQIYNRKRNAMNYTIDGYQMIYPLEINTS
jgi:hypothetical protein